MVTSLFSKKLPFFVRFSRDTKIAFFDLVCFVFLIAAFISIYILTYLREHIAGISDIPFLPLVPIWVFTLILINSLMFAIFRILFRLPLKVFLSGFVFCIAASLPFFIILCIESAAFVWGTPTVGDAVALGLLPAYFILFIFSYYVAVCTATVIRNYEKNKKMMTYQLISFVIMATLWVSFFLCALYVENGSGYDIMPVSWLTLISIPPSLAYIMFFRDGNGSRFFSFIILIDAVSLISLIAAFPVYVYLHGMWPFSGIYLYPDRPAPVIFTYVAASYTIAAILRLPEYLTHPLFLKILPESKNENKNEDETGRKTTENHPNRLEVVFSAAEEFAPGFLRFPELKSAGPIRKIASGLVKNVDAAMVNVRTRAP